MAPPLLAHLRQQLPRLPNSSTYSHLSIPVFMCIAYYVQKKTNSHFSPIVHVTLCHTNNPKIQKQLLISQWCALKLTWHGINRWGNSNTNLKRQKRKTIGSTSWSCTSPHVPPFTLTTSQVSTKFCKSCHSISLTAWCSEPLNPASWHTC